MCNHVGQDHAVPGALCVDLHCCAQALQHVILVTAVAAWLSAFTVRFWVMQGGFKKVPPKVKKPAAKKTSAAIAAAAAAEAKARASKKGKTKDKSTFNQVSSYHHRKCLALCQLFCTCCTLERLLAFLFSWHLAATFRHKRSCGQSFTALQLLTASLTCGGSLAVRLGF